LAAAFAERFDLHHDPNHNRGAGGEEGSGLALLPVNFGQDFLPSIFRIIPDGAGSRAM